MSEQQTLWQRHGGKIILASVVGGVIWLNNANSKPATPAPVTPRYGYYTGEDRPGGRRILEPSTGERRHVRLSARRRAGLRRLQRPGRSRWRRRRRGLRVGRSRALRCEPFPRCSSLGWPVIASGSATHPPRWPDTSASARASKERSHEGIQENVLALRHQWYVTKQQAKEKAPNKAKIASKKLEAVGRNLTLFGSTRR